MTELLATVILPYLGTEGGWWASYNIKAMSPAPLTVTVQLYDSAGKNMGLLRYDIKPLEGISAMVPAGVETVVFEGLDGQFAVTAFQGKGDPADLSAPFAYPKVHKIDPKN